MFEVMVNGICVFQRYSEKESYDYFELCLKEPCHYSRVALYFNGKCLRQVGSPLEEEPYNLPHSD
jgi:hypothetical protein